MTKPEALDKFCLYRNFAENGKPGETKVQFLQRQQKEWAIECVMTQVMNEQEVAKQTAVSTQTAGLDI